MTTARVRARGAFLALGILLAAALAGGAAAPQLPAAPDEDWFVIRIGGSAVGTASERWTTGDREINFQAQMNLSFTRMGTPLSMTILTEEACTPAGKFRGGGMEGAVPTHTP